MRASKSRKRPERVFWLLIFFLVVVAFTGGSSRIDVQSLVILRPLSVIGCAIALLSMQRRHLVGRGGLLLSMVLVLLLSLGHELPLPPAIWQALPGRREIAEIDKVAGLGKIWRPLTLTPMNGWHAFASLFAPLAVILFGVQLSRDDLRRLLPCLILLGGLSGLLGLVQIIGGPHGELNFYRITNKGSAVGLFANRNHAALLLALMFPLLSVWTLTGKTEHKRQRSRILTAVIAAVLLFPLILVTGSRSGLLLSVFGILMAAALAGKRLLGREMTVRLFGLRIHKLLVFFLGGAGLISLFGFYFTRAQAVQRLLEQPIENENRWDFWNICMQIFWKYFPAGSGSGSFVEVYQIAEPTYILNPTYLNRAHNELIEVGITFGAVGLIFIFVSLGYYIKRMISLWWRTDTNENSTKLAQAAGVAMSIVSFASLTDYPLRTPIMACLFAVLVLWFTSPAVHEGPATVAPSSEA